MNNDRVTFRRTVHLANVEFTVWKIHFENAALADDSSLQFCVCDKTMRNDEPILRDLQLSKGNSQFTGINFSLKREFPSFYSAGSSRIKCVLFVRQLIIREFSPHELRVRRVCGALSHVQSAQLPLDFQSRSIWTASRFPTGCWRNHETVTTNLLFNSRQSNLPFFSFFVSLQDREMIIWPYLWETEAQPWAWRWLKED